MHTLKSALTMNAHAREAFEAEERRRTEVVKRLAIHGVNASVKMARAELKRRRRQARNLALIER